MATFHYKAKNLKGEAFGGEIESSDSKNALLILRKKNLIVTELKEVNKDRSRILGRIFDRISGKDLVVVTRQLAVMIEAGLTLSEAIDILEEQQSNKRLKGILTEVSHDIKSGFSLNKALSKHSDAFPQLYVSLIKSGETSGKLDLVLTKMAGSMEKNLEFEGKIRGAMIYPAVVVMMMLVVMIIMLTFVVPKLTMLYQEATLDLPLPTKILIGASHLLVNYWWVILLLSMTLVLLLKRWMKQPESELAMTQLFLKIPVTGKLMTNIALANFTRTFALLISAGVSLLEAIDIVVEVTQNSVYKNALKAARFGVERGLSFSAQLLAVTVFPKIVGQMARVGEETGKIDEVFFKLSEYFEGETDQMVKNITVIIEPVVLIVLGIGVGFLVLSIILPIYKLTTAI